jgi:dTDP-4-amino-4,6-dideoxygalactose transaminase
MARAAVMTRLTEAGIGSQVHYLPLHMQPYYRDRYGEISLPGAEAFYSQALSLPLFPDMTEEEVDYVVETLGVIVGGA